MSLKRRHSDVVENNAGAGPSSDVFESEPIEDRTSTFVAYFSPTVPPKELQKHGEAKSASHRMLAWRTRSSAQRTIGSGQRSLETGYDDDGEKFGGKRVLSVLESLKVEGSIVVARWYGGVMLGPVRFTHIENCAREAVQAWHQHQQAQILEKSRLLEEKREILRLTEELKERDGSIAALRGLLESKTKQSDTSTSARDDSKHSSQPQAMDYDSLPLQRLRLLDKARDRTIEFLLKQIDAAEKKVETPQSLTSADGISAVKTSDPVPKPP